MLSIKGGLFGDITRNSSFEDISSLTKSYMHSENRTAARRTLF